MRRVWLGCPEPSWLLPGYGPWGSPEQTAGLGLCVSATRIRRIADPRDWARARREAWYYDGEPPVPWMLDSGAFTEITTYGRWRTTPLEWAELVAWCDGFDGGTARVRSIEVAWPQDVMCERHVLAITGLTVEDHLRATVSNTVAAMNWWPELSDAPCPIRPVVQGSRVRDYQLCARMLTDAGVDLAGGGLVGVGSVCGRDSVGEVRDIAEALHDLGLTRLHGFGVKTDGLRRLGHLFESVDSQAWSLDARYSPPEPGCGHRRCTNCWARARRWWNEQQALAGQPAPDHEQLRLLDIA